MRYLVFIAALALSGCAAFKGKEIEFSCPKTGLIQEASVIAMPVSAPKEAVVATARFDSFGGGCKYKGKGEAWVDLSLPVTAQKGVAAPADLKTYEFPYFIAVLAPDETVLQRQMFSTKVDFDNALPATTVTEEHRIKIPIAKPEDSGQYKIAFGFILPQPPAPPAPALPVPEVKKESVHKTKTTKKKKSNP